ncbi:DUF1178 family protein [Pigmentiphaga aceris]|uniref:DUF1178 family protein n=1 Tax=Pigmentiphaga aceris TaxID=1940612 RepID=A0A5C0AWY8_9BURK|nr:DUF1178 family protein [Pigmentiphaga aceris]QEI06114.1 DUF1178 family protein [Pigmentiphaga aceris]
MPLKVFDLQCTHHHVFEGWFQSREEFDSQLERKEIACPVCGDTGIERKLSAPRLNIGHLQAPSPGNIDPAIARRELMRQVREVIKQTEDVGENFADEARRIHHGVVPERAIRGVTTPDEREALADEGIEVVSLPNIVDDDKLH